MRRPARRSATPGAPHHGSTGVTVGAAVEAARARAARARYSPEPIEDRCGVRTSPTTFSAPEVARPAAASSMEGSVCLAPKATR